MGGDLAAAGCVAGKARAVVAEGGGARALATDEAGVEPSVFYLSSHQQQTLARDPGVGAAVAAAHGAVVRNGTRSSAGGGAVATGMGASALPARGHTEDPHRGQPHPTATPPPSTPPSTPPPSTPSPSTPPPSMPPPSQRHVAQDAVGRCRGQSTEATPSPPRCSHGTTGPSQTPETCDIPRDSARLCEIPPPSFPLAQRVPRGGGSRGGV